VNAIEMAKNYCVNGNYQDGKNLVEMYLVHIDTELMIFQIGIGDDLKRLRNP
jgi:hypothetical protein